VEDDRHYRKCLRVTKRRMLGLGCGAVFKSRISIEQNCVQRLVAEFRIVCPLRVFVLRPPLVQNCHAAKRCQEISLIDVRCAKCPINRIFCARGPRCLMRDRSIAVTVSTRRWSNEDFSL
jgi:hypothetical protein